MLPRVVFCRHVNHHLADAFLEFGILNIFFPFLNRPKTPKIDVLQFSLLPFSAYRCPKWIVIFDFVTSNIGALMCIEISRQLCLSVKLFDLKVYFHWYISHYFLSGSVTWPRVISPHPPCFYSLFVWWVMIPERRFQVRSPPRTSTRYQVGLHVNLLQCTTPGRVLGRGNIVTNSYWAYKVLRWPNIGPHDIWVSTHPPSPTTGPVTQGLISQFVKFGGLSWPPDIVTAPMLVCFIDLM